MAERLMFVAHSNDRAYGFIVVSGGLANARVDGRLLENATLSHALLWVKRHNPSPEHLPLIHFAGLYEVHQPDSCSRRRLGPHEMISNVRL